MSLLLPIVALAATTSSVQVQQPVAMNTPSASQRAWQDLEIGVFIHFAPNTWADAEGDDTTTPLSRINPTKLDTDQWVATAKSLGAKYIVFVAKHVGGFCMWQTATTDYSLKSIPWRNGKGDVLADLRRSCDRAGLKLGVYVSPCDAKHGAAVSGRCATPEAQEAYNKLYRAQLTELLTNYGSMVEVWFDGSQTVPVGDILRKHAPKAMVFQGPNATIRWVGNEDGFAPYPAWSGLRAEDARTGIATALHGDPDGDAWMPLEVDVSMRRPNWFWSTKNEHLVLSKDALLELYYKSVGRGANLLLNLTPDTSGLIPAADANRAREFGEEVRRRFGRALGSTRGTELRFPSPQKVDHIVIEEDLRKGERIRAYRIEGLVGSDWVALGDGFSVGHKRIQPVAPTEVAALRLVVTQSSADPVIRRFAAYRTHAEPPKNWNADAGIWANEAVGGWSNPGSIDLDLTNHVQAAATFSVRFVGASGQVPALTGLELMVDGTPQAHLVRKDPKHPDTVLVTMPGLSKSVHLKAKIENATRGTVLIRRI